jgi:hypothetical protein
MEKVRDREDALAQHAGRMRYPLRLTRVKVCFLMPTEISIPDAEDLKSRVRELRRFL